MPSIDVFARTALVVVFALAVASKLWSREAWTSFAATLPSFGAPVAVAPLVVCGELVAAVGLVTLPGVGLAVATALLIAFVIAIGGLLHAQREVSCRCFGATEAPMSATHLVRNGVLLALVAVSALARSRTGELDLATSMFAGVVVGFAITRWDELVYLGSPIGAR